MKQALTTVCDGAPLDYGLLDASRSKRVDPSMILLSGSDMTFAIAREHASEQIGLTTKMASHTLRKTLKRSYPVMIRERFSFFGYYLTIQSLITSVLPEKRSKKPV